jgi:AcrR family transcriptional regulator
VTEAVPLAISTVERGPARDYADAGALQRAATAPAGGRPKETGTSVAKQANKAGPATSKSDRDAEATRLDILEVAAREFADKGLSGARIDEIAEKTNSSKRMIYYYFGSKEDLYCAVLEQAYADIRHVDAEASFADMAPDEALRELVRRTFDYHHRHPDFVRLVMNENIHHGAYIAKVTGIQERNTAAIARVADILARGVAARMFRKDIKPVELHMTISALCFYNVSNRYTFSFGFKHDMTSPKAMRARRERVVEIVERWCLL